MDAHDKPTFPTPDEDSDRERAVSEAVDRRLAELRERDHQEADQRKREAREHADRLYTKGYDGPHPAEIAQALGEDVGSDPYVGPGAVTHHRPYLTTGSAGDDVEDLVRLLKAAGYADNSLVRGENPSRVLDTSIMTEVRRFARDYGIENHESEWQGQAVPANELQHAYVGPYIWQALLTVAQAKEDERREQANR